MRKFRSFQIVVACVVAVVCADHINKNAEVRSLRNVIASNFLRNYLLFNILIISRSINRKIPVMVLINLVLIQPMVFHSRKMVLVVKEPAVQPNGYHLKDNKSYFNTPPMPMVIIQLVPIYQHHHQCQLPSYVLSNTFVHILHKKNHCVNNKSNNVLVR